MIHECLQGSVEWSLLRMGKITGSNFSEVLNKKTGRTTYMRKLAAEILTGCQAESFKSSAMQAGSDTEAEAKGYYTELYGEEVLQVGFVEVDSFLGVSPDGLIGDDGGIEIKCPLPGTHIGYIDEDRIPPEYIPQVQGNLLCTGRKWWEFVSYCPTMIDRKIFVKRAERDEAYIANLSAEIERFKSELKELIERIRNPY